MASDATEAEPFDVSKYVAQVEKSIADAEQHLNVPPGTISSIPSDPDYIATIKTHAVIESMLNELIAKHPPRRSYEGGPLGGPPETSLGPNANECFREFVVDLPMKGRVGKLDLAKGLNLLAEQHAEFIDGVASVRNRYAHSVKNMDRSIKDILTEEQQHNNKTVERVIGWPGVNARVLENSTLKTLMYHRLAAYLADVLETLHPPNVPSLLQILELRNTPLALKVGASEASED